MVALAFSISYSTVKFFNLSFAVDIVYSAYLFKTFFHHFQFNPIFAAFFAITFCVVFQLILFKYLYSRINGNNGFFRLVASIGVLVIMQNILSIAYGDSSLVNSISQNEKFGFGNIVITSNQALLLLSASLLFLVNYFVFRFSHVGKLIKAVSSNKNLSIIYGIDSGKTELLSCIFSSIIFSFAGILYSFYTVLNPMYGFDFLLYGIIAMIIGGTGSTWGLVGGALILSTSQHIGAYYIDSKWMDAIAYLILIMFLIWKPLGISGRQLKKVEI
jgi:branched-chain amino acid transport system permease protein